MNRLITLAALAIPFSFALGCAELESSDSTDLGTASQEATVQCWSDVAFDGKWPTISGWNGQAPQSIGPSQVFVLTPITGYNNQYFLISQVNWSIGKIHWAAWAHVSQRPQVMATLAVQPGGINAIGGTRYPPISVGFPPITRDGQIIHGLAANDFAPLP